MLEGRLQNSGDQAEQERVTDIAQLRRLEPCWGAEEVVLHDPLRPDAPIAYLNDPDELETWARVRQFRAWSANALALNAQILSEDIAWLLEVSNLMTIVFVFLFLLEGILFVTSFFLQRLRRQSYAKS